MSHSPFSAQWFRVAGLRPRLAADLRVQRQRVRGSLWHVLSLRVGAETGVGATAADASLAAASSAAACRLNAAAYAVAARFDGSRSVQAVWDALQHGEADGPTQDDVLHTLLTLHAHRLVEFDHAPDFGALRATASDVDAPHARASAASNTANAANKPRASFNPLFMRLPLFNPSRLLNRLMPCVPFLFGRIAAALWTLAVLAMFIASALHAGELKAHTAQWMTTPRYLLLAALLVVPIKALHELGHALAVRRFGGEVRHAGLSLMVLMPMPYVDASAAAGFTRAGQRALVSGAGIMVELAIAALGLALWFHTDGGWLHDAGFVAWFVGSVSTLLFNANPLQRFDGYYLLTDLLQLPNLGPRSRAFWLERLRGWVASNGPGADQHDLTQSMPTAPGERPWLWLYAPASWLYQVGLLATMTLWLGGVSQWLGWAMCAWLAVQTLWPALKLLLDLWRTALEPHHDHQTSPGWLPAGVWRVAALAALPVLALCVPLPDSDVVRGVVWARDDALLRAATEGFVVKVQAQDGAAVQRGDLLLELSNPRLQAERESVAAQLDIAEHQQFQSFGEDGTLTGNAQEDAQRLHAELARLDERLANLQVRAQVAGRVVIPNAADLPGSYVQRGALLGHVLTGEPTLLRVVVAHDEAVRLRERMRGVQARVADAADQAQPGELLRDTVSATRDLPSAALSEHHGGQVLTDPKDEQDRRALEPVVVMDVLLPRSRSQTQPQSRGGTRKPDTETSAERIGTRAWVRFDLGWAPLAAQLSRWGRERVQSRFNPSR